MTSKEYLWDMVNSIQYIPLKNVCFRVLKNEVFLKGYGSSVGGPHAHHDYPGGLVVHTAEVMQNAMNMAGSLSKPQPRLDVLIAGSLYHDYLKTRDYSAEGLPTSYRQLIRHPAGSFAAFAYNVEKWDEENPDNIFNDDLYKKIGHCILSHHGRHEWGAAVEPQTIEAHIIHYSDMLSMMYGAGRTQVV